MLFKYNLFKEFVDRCNCIAFVDTIVSLLESCFADLKIAKNISKWKFICARPKDLNDHQYWKKWLRKFEKRLCETPKSS